MALYSRFQRLLLLFLFGIVRPTTTGALAFTTSSSNSGNSGNNLQQQQQEPRILVSNDCCTLTALPTQQQYNNRVQYQDQQPSIEDNGKLYSLRRYKAKQDDNDQDNLLIATLINQEEDTDCQDPDDPSQSNSNIIGTRPLQLSEHFLLSVHKPPPPSPPSSPDHTEINNMKEHNAPIGTRLLYSDNLVNIWEFSIQPKQSFPYHVHRQPYLFLNLEVSVTQGLNQQGKPDEASPPRMQQQDQVTFVQRQQLGAHGVLNVGSGLFQQFIVEFCQW